jgi:hypothetical protein
VVVPPEEHFGDNLRAWAEYLAAPNLRPGESLQDFMAGAMYLAEKRARLYRRPPPPTSLDLLFQLLIWGICMFERYYPPGFGEQLGRIRQDLFTGAATGNLERLEAAVPDSTLLLPIETIYTLHALNNIDGFLRIPRSE